MEYYWRSEKNGVFFFSEFVDGYFHREEREWDGKPQYLNDGELAVRLIFEAYWLSADGDILPNTVNIALTAFF